MGQMQEPKMLATYKITMTNERPWHGVGPGGRVSLGGVGTELTIRLLIRGGTLWLEAAGRILTVPHQ